MRIVLSWLITSLLFLPLPSAAAPGFDWGHSFGLDSRQRIFDSVLDPDGAVYITGEFEQSLDLGTGNLFSGGATDLFVARLDPSGHAVWARSFGGPGLQTGSDIAVDGAGNVIVAGYFTDSFDIGDSTLTSAGSFDYFLAKFTPDGSDLWSRRFGDASYQQQMALAVDGPGNIVVAASPIGMVDFGGGPLGSEGVSQVLVARFDPDGHHLWSKAFGDSTFQRATDVAVDGDGNILLGGQFLGTIDFGGGPLTTAGADDIFVAKLESNGNHVWSRRFGDAGSQDCRSVTADPSGHLIATGSNYGSIDFGAGPITSHGPSDIYIVSLDAGGMLSWAHGFGAGGLDAGYTVASDGAGNILFTGYFVDTLDVGGGPLVQGGYAPNLLVARFTGGGAHSWSHAYATNAGFSAAPISADAAGNVVFTGRYVGTVPIENDTLRSGPNGAAFLAKLDSGGSGLWNRVLGKLPGEGVGTSTVIDGVGNVIVVGAFQGTIDFGDGPLTTGNDHDVCVLKFDPHGQLLWSRRFGGADLDVPWQVAIDASDNIILTGLFLTSIDFGGGELVSAGGGDIFLAKLAPDGHHLWSRRFGGPGPDEGRTVVVDHLGNIVLGGWFGDSVDFGGGALTHIGPADVFVAKFDGGGGYLWSRRFGGPGTDMVADLDVDTSGNIALTGEFADSIEFGGGSLVSDGALDIFLAKLDSGGNHLWSHRFGGAGDQQGMSLDIDGAGNILTAGNFSGEVDFPGGPLTANVLHDSYLAKFDPGGNLSWSRDLGISTAATGLSVATDAGGTVYLAGGYGDLLDFGDGGHPSAGGSDAFVSRFGAGGDHLGSQTFGGPESEASLSIAVDPVGNFALTGFSYGDFDFGDGIHHANLAGSLYVVRFNADQVPVTIASFTAAWRSGVVDLDWEVASDESGAMFNLNRWSDLDRTPVTIASGPIGGRAPTFSDADIEPGHAYDYQLAIRTRDGVEIRSDVALVTIPGLTALLAQNIPNPFMPETSIRYVLSVRTRTAMEIFDASGRLVVRLDQGMQDAGPHVVAWNGRDESGRDVGSGVYFYRLEGMPRGEVMKMLRVR